MSKPHPFLSATFHHRSSRPNAAHTSLAALERLALPQSPSSSLSSSSSSSASSSASLHSSSVAVPFLRAHADFAARYRPLDAEDVFYNAEQRAFVDPPSQHSNLSAIGATGAGTVSGTNATSGFEGGGRVHGIITQNVDSLHSRAGAMSAAFFVFRFSFLVF